MHQSSMIKVSLAAALVLSIGLVSTAGMTAAAETTSPAPSASPLRVVDRVEAAIPVPGSPDWPTPAFGSLWVLAPDLPIRPGGGTPNLVRIDPTTNAITATIELPDRLCQGLVASDDAIWVCAADALLRIDPDTDSIAASVPIKGAPAFYRMAYGGGMVWALGSGAFAADTVIRLDPTTQVTTSHPAGGSVGGLTYAFDALWLTIPGNGSVVRMDPATGETRELISGLPAPTQITAGPDSLWVTLYGGDEEQAGAGDPQVVRLDPETGEVIAEIAVGGSPRGGVDVLAGEDGVWVRSTRPWLTRIDPATNTVIEALASEPEIHAIQGPLAEAFGSIWTVNIEEDTVYRLEP